MRCLKQSFKEGRGAREKSRSFGIDGLHCLNRIPGLGDDADATTYPGDLESIDGAADVADRRGNVHPGVGAEFPISHQGPGKSVDCMVAVQDAFGPARTTRRVNHDPHRCVVDERRRDYTLNFVDKRFISWYVLPPAANSEEALLVAGLKTDAGNKFLIVRLAEGSGSK